MRNSIRYGAIVAALVACQAMAQTTMTLKVFTGGDNKASQWKEPANCSDPAPQFDSANAKGSGDPVVTYSSGAQITWSVKVEVGGSVQLFDAYLGANYTYVPKGAANVVASLELRKDNATGPLAAVRGDSGAWAKWYSSINDGSTTSTRYTVCGTLDPFKLAAFPVAWSADDGTTWGKIIDKPVNGGPMDAAFYQYPSSAGYPATSTAAAGTLVGIGAGYQSFTWAADKPGIGVSAWSPDAVNHPGDTCFALLENGPAFEGQIDTTTLGGTYVLIVKPGTGCNVLKDPYSLENDNCNVLDGVSFAMKADTTVGDAVTIIITQPAAPAAPVVTAPTGTGIPVLPTVQWTPGAGGGVVTGFDVYIDSTKQNATPLAPSATSFTLTTPLAYATAYTAKVVAIGQPGADSTDSNVVNFTTVYETPSKATLVAPANGATCVATSQTLEWTPGTPSTGVRVYFGTATLDEVLPTPASPWAATLAAGTSYQWRVDTVNGDQTTTGDVWTFSTAGTVSPATNGAPTADQTIGASVNLTWTAGAGATKYDVTFNGVTTNDVVGTSFGPVTVVAGANTCSVVAKDDCGGVAAALNWSFNGVSACTRTIAARKVFYNNSYWDNNNAAVQLNSATNNHDDDNDAIATDKVALVPGGTASFANYISFDKGITGIMVDLNRGAGCSAPVLTVADFTFQVGNVANPAAWAAAAAPSAVVVTAGGGVGGSDRVTITWATGAIPNHNWLRVTVLANANTNLAAADVFYFGLAKGEANSLTSGQAVVNSTDELAARAGPRVTFPSRTLITNILDFNRDSFENSTDDLISRNNSKAFPTALKLTGITW